MHTPENVEQADRAPDTVIMVFEGEARSGKGTSLNAVMGAIQELDQTVTKIDQGLKFRSLTKLALEAGVDLTDEPKLTDFLRADTTHDDMLELLARVERAPKKQLDELLYTHDINHTVKYIGNNPRSHEIAVELLFSQVEAAVARQSSAVLIDGRCMDKYARVMDERGLASYVLGFYFRCDVGIAARRSLGTVKDYTEMSKPEQREYGRIVAEITDRNRQDAQRSVDPMREPASAMSLDLLSFKLSDDAYLETMTRDAMQHGMVTVNTSYTRSVEDMTTPVVALATAAYQLRRAELIAV